MKKLEDKIYKSAIDGNIKAQCFLLRNLNPDSPRENDYDEKLWGDDL